MRRRRKKTRLKAKPILWLLMTLVLIAGIGWSPVTAVRKVRIEGATEADQQRLAGIVSTLQGVPCIQIDPRDVESQALSSSEVKQASLSRTPFGTATLSVKYRNPVGRLIGSPNVLLSDDGVLYASSQTFENLPMLQLATGGPPTLVTIASNWQPRILAKLAQEARTLVPSGVIRIQVEPGGVVWLNVDSGRVILGSLDDLDKKMAILKKRLADFPNELEQHEALNLTDPENPSLVPRKVNSRS